MSSCSPQPRPSWRVMDGDSRPDPALRLRRFREEHPDIEIGRGSAWEAVIPEPDGAQRVIVRYELHDLLDEAERRLEISAGTGVTG